LRNCFLDTETCGLFGPPVIMQVGYGNRKPFIHHIWSRTAQSTMRLIENIVKCRVVAHNLNFDWQKMQSLYQNLLVLSREFGPRAKPQDHIEFFARECEPNGWAEDVCLKPAGSICTLTLAQKTLGGTSLAAKAIYIRKVPAMVAQQLCDWLEEETNLPEILFVRRKTRWTVRESDHGLAWRDVVLSFGPSNALKDVCKHVLGSDVVTWDESDAGTLEWPKEEGYCPIAARLDEGNWTYDKGKLWPALIRQHIDHWASSDNAEKYALSDVYLVRALYKHFGSPTNDFDSDLITQVASVRQRGFDFNVAGMQELAVQSAAYVANAEINVDSPKQVRQYLAEVLDPAEAIIVEKSAAKAVLKNIRKTFTLDEEEECCDEGCPRCDFTGKVGPGPMPVVARVNHIEEVRKHTKRLQVFNKLLVAGRAYPNFKVVGSKSGRMAGTDGLNFHGIDKKRDIRDLFTFKRPGWILSGGDYDSQELAIAGTAYDDLVLVGEISKGKSLHGLFGAEVYNTTYEDIMENKADGRYDKAKTGMYALLYGAAPFKIAQSLGIPEHEANVALERFFKKYASTKKTRERLASELTSLRSVDGGAICWQEPLKDHVDSVFGFRRSFEVENLVIRMLVEVLPKLHDLFGKYKATVERKVGKPQTITGAVYSAIYGAAFSLQGKIIRSALNHIIQSTGRTVTLGLQHNLWELQPVGIHPWRICLMSIHDEVVAESAPEDGPVILERVQNKLMEQCKTIPLLSIGWSPDLSCWGELKSAKGVHCGFEIPE
jgi:hypothetical protein